MSNTNSTIFLKADIMDSNIITTGYDYSRKESDPEVEINNDLVITITNLSRTDTIELYYDSSKQVPSINDTASYEEQPRIYIYFPLGDMAYHMTTIELAKRIKCSVSRGWTVVPCDADKSFAYGIYWAVMPDTPDINLKFRPGDSLIIHFEGIMTYKESNRMSCACIDILDIDGVDNNKEYLPVYIVRPEPKIRRFTCSQNFAGILDKVRFNWEVLGNIKQTRFFPSFADSGETSIPAKSSADCIITESTDYTIRVYGEDNIVYGYCPVVVDEPKIELKTLDGRTKYKYGDEIALSVKLFNTNHYYLNEGIGRVDVETKFVEGYPVIEDTKKVVCNNRKVEFCVSCLGKKELVKETILLEIIDFLDIINIVYTRSYLPNKNTYSYTLYWNVVNATWLEIRTSDNIERTNSKEGKPVLSGRVEFENSSKEALKITIEAKGSGGQYVKDVRECQKM